VPSVSKVVRITEDNDPNDKIGRPGGYVDGAVLYDKAASCTELGADCGATIEIWGSPEDAKSRAAYIARTYKDAPALGSEYLYLDGTTLLRVDDQLKPSTARAYAKAIAGVVYKT
jgi:hypothetical protein